MDSGGKKSKNKLFLKNTNYKFKFIPQDSQ